MKPTKQSTLGLVEESWLKTQVGRLRLTHTHLLLSLSSSLSMV